jgi:anti-sigma factor RsiW
MNCPDAEVLIHALIDGELDASHARDVEAHLETCLDCSIKLADLRTMHQSMAAAALKESAPAHLRARIEAALPASSPRAATTTAPGFNSRRLPVLCRRLRARHGALRGDRGDSFVGRTARRSDQRITGEVVSAHLRSLQPGHLTDVETSDQHTVKPWFKGKLDVAPPVIDLTAQGFTLIGGRLDDIGGETVAAIVYRRRNHVINLFIAEGLGAKPESPAAAARHGFNVRHWREGGLDFWAVSDVNADELAEFEQKFFAALRRRAASG